MKTNNDPIERGIHVHVYASHGLHEFMSASLGLNPLHANFFRGNKKMCLHFMSFPLTNMAQVAETLLCVRQGHTYFTQSINIMGADVLATYGARTSAAMIITTCMSNKKKLVLHVNSLALERCGYNLELIISNFSKDWYLEIFIWNCTEVNATRPYWQLLTDNQSTLVQVRAWHNQAPGPYLN